MDPISPARKYPVDNGKVRRVIVRTAAPIFLPLPGAQPGLTHPDRPKNSLSLLVIDPF